MSEVSTHLHDRFYAVIAATRIASSMGAAVEGWSPEKIEGTHGTLEELLEYEHYDNGWKRPPGTTEDGIERQKLMCEAIERKGGRITARDLVDTWVDVVDPEKSRYMTEPFDRKLLKVAQSGLVPPNSMGQLVEALHINTTARSFHAIMLINAGDEAGVIEDMDEIASVYQHRGSLAYPWGHVYNAAMVAALESGSTVDGIVEAGLAHATGPMREQIERVLSIVDGEADVMSMRKSVNAVYEGRAGAYPYSWIDENVTKAFAILKKAGADVRAAIVAGVNFGRDTDCTAASASGLVAAHAGSATIPGEWVEQVDAATMQNPYTCIQKTIRQSADDMHAAYVASVEKLQGVLSRKKRLMEPRAVAVHT